MPEDGVVSEQKHPINLILGKQSRPKQPQEDEIAFESRLGPRGSGLPYPSRREDPGSGIRC